VEGVRALARVLAPSLPASNFRAEPVEHMSFDDASADLVISNTVLHFARNDAPLRIDAAGCMASPEARRDLILPPRILDRNGKPGKTYRGAALLVARRLGAVLGGRSAARLGHRMARRRTGRPAENDGRSRPTRHDHVGIAQETDLKQLHPKSRRRIPADWVNLLRVDFETKSILGMRASCPPGKRPNSFVT
jgi:hypothetical protein